jgi:hypothetical protein
VKAFLDFFWSESAGVGGERERERKRERDEHMDYFSKDKPARKIIGEINIMSCF